MRHALSSSPDVQKALHQGWAAASAKDKASGNFIKPQDRKEVLHALKTQYE